MAEPKVILDRLNDFNWSSWKFRMELMLMKENLWTTVKEAKPEAVTAAWTRNNEKARATIGLALDDSQLTHIIGAATAKEMWDKLKGYHERGTLSNKIHVLRRLCSMRLTENGSMSDHLVQASELVQRLASMGESLKDHLVVAILLSSLPRTYDPLVLALEARPEEDLKVDYVKGKLLDEWRKRCEVRAEEPKVEETAMKSAVQKEPRIRSGRRARVCHHCKKEEHFWRFCPVLQAKMKKSEAKSQAKATVASSGDQVGGSSSRNVCFTTKTAEDVSVGGRWIIDTGCTRHMTGSTVNFDGITFSEEKVPLADGRTVTARGVRHGRTTSVAADGVKIDIKLKEVLYVPGLTGSVLSVSAITRNGCEVVFGEKGCRILKNGEVLAVGDRVAGFYYLRQYEVGPEF